MSEQTNNTNKPATPPPPTPNKPSTPEGGNKPFKFNMGWIYGLIIIMIAAMYFNREPETQGREISWSEFKTYSEQDVFSKWNVSKEGSIIKATVKPEFAEEIMKSDSSATKQEFRKNVETTIIIEIPNPDAARIYADELEKKGIKPDVKFVKGSSTFWNILWQFGPFLLLIFVWIYIIRRMGGGNPFGVGKTKAQLYDKTGKTQKITFKDVAGLSEAKQEVEEIVDFLKKPGKYTELGAKIPKGALLVGPPGTGKTLLAKAVAGEADVPFFSLSGSDFVEMFVGVGASRVRDLFRQAKEKAPCIVFIDEIDAVGRARGRNPSMGANDERENTLNQLLTEMDGFGSNSGVIILAATNRVDILDKALLRAGRFDRQINVELPELPDRKEIFLVHLRNIKIDQSVDTEFLARQTPGFSGADIANVCNEAALIAARHGKENVQREDFMNAVDRIVGGLEKKSKVTTLEERRSIAIHEAGHATLSWMLEHANPLVKVTIVPRGKALGAAWYMPEERQITTRQQLEDEICATLGGRAAEDLVLGRISTGAANDLERVTKQAYAMVVYYGMGKEIPNLNYYDSSGQDYGFTKPYSDETARLIDEEVKHIINTQYERAKQILAEHSSRHQQLSEVLLDKEVIFSDDLEKIFGKRKWLSRSQEILKQQEILEDETKKTEESGDLEEK
jgi:cell division protease FtsH